VHVEVALITHDEVPAAKDHEKLLVHENGLVRVGFQKFVAGHVGKGEEESVGVRRKGGVSSPGHCGKAAEDHVVAVSNQSQGGALVVALMVEHRGQEAVSRGSVKQLGLCHFELRLKEPPLNLESLFRI